MAFQLDAYWVWDFWLADDGEQYHMFFLHAPRALGDPDLRHRSARIGHATSTDLRTWTSHGQIFELWFDCVVERLAVDEFVDAAGIDFDSGHDGVSPA